MDLRVLASRYLPAPVRAYYGTRSRLARTCNLCGYTGSFKFFGHPPRIDAMCKRCGSLERHRMFWLWYERSGADLPGPMLHFAPEAVLRAKFSERYGPEAYRTTDINPAGVDIALDIEAIDLPDGSIGTIVCNHVLEHVDDHKAMRELARILADDGALVCSVPLVDGWEHTYENPEGAWSEAAGCALRPVGPHPALRSGLHDTAARRGFHPHRRGDSRRPGHRAPQPRAGRPRVHLPQGLIGRPCGVSRSRR